MAAPRPSDALALTDLESLSDGDLAVRIDYYLGIASSPGCSLAAAPGVWLQVMTLLAERAARSSRKTETAMNRLAWVVSVATLIGVGFQVWEALRP